MPNDELSLVAFSNSTSLIAPFSSDKITLNSLIQGIGKSAISTDSVNLTVLEGFTERVF